MKKLLLVSCLLLTLCIILVSCDSVPLFLNVWSRDETSHWREFIIPFITDDVADKADHSWDEGEVITKARQGEDGTSSFTCTVCGYKKTETVKFTGLTEDEWENAISYEALKNFEYEERSYITMNGKPIETVTHCKFTEDNAWVSIGTEGKHQSDYASSRAEAIATRKQLVKSIMELAPYKCYEYDPEMERYEAIQSLYIKALGETTSDISITLDADNRVVEIAYYLTFTRDGVTYDVRSYVTISNHGQVSLTPQK